MTNAQLTTLLTSADDAQIQQAITHFEQQKQIPQDLLTECLVAWQLVKDKKIRKQLLTLLNTYTPNAFQIFLANKYLLEKQKETKKANKIWQEIASHQIIDTQKLTYYLCSFFPSLLFSQISFITDPDLKKGLPDKFKNVESLSLTDIKLVQADFTILAEFKNLKKLNLSGCQLTELPAVISTLTSLEELDVRKNPISALNDFNFLDQFPHLQKFGLWNYTFEKQANATIADQLKQLKKLEFYGHNGCRLTQLPAAISILPALEELRLTGININQADFTPLQGLKNLKKLDLDEFKFTQLPAAINELTSLKELKLSANNIFKGDFTPLRGLKNLKKLSLLNYKFTQLPTGISELTSLEEVWLGNNNLSQANFTPLQGLKNLKKLNLYGCKLTQLPASISALVGLEELIVLGNPISVLKDFNFLDQFPHLQKFGIWNLTLEKQANATIADQLKQLKKLNLKYCELTQLPAVISALTSLEELDLEPNDLSQADFTPLQGLKNLKKLNLRNCKLTQLPAVISALTSLEDLDLGWNKLTQADFTVLQGLKNLKKLELRGCGLMQLPAELKALQEKGVRIDY